MFTVSSKDSVISSKKENALDFLMKKNMIALIHQLSWMTYKYSWQISEESNEPVNTILKSNVFY